MGPGSTVQIVGKPLIPRHRLSLPGAIRSDSVGRRQKHGQSRNTTLISFSLMGKDQFPMPGPLSLIGDSDIEGFLATAWGSWHLQADKARSTVKQSCAVGSPGPGWLLVKSLHFLPPRPFHQGLTAWQLPSSERLLQQGAAERGRMGLGKPELSIHH